MTEFALTDRQLEILEFLRRYQREHYMPPTMREICDEFGFVSTNAASEHLHALARKGFVAHRPRIARGWVARRPEVA